MSRKSSWWLRPQRKGASNRAALNEANYFMEHNKVLLERIKELAAENAKLRELVDAWMGCGTRYHTMQGACPMFDADAEDFCKAASIARELGVEVDG